MLGLLSCLVSNIRAAKSHPILDSEISPAFWAACLYVESEAVKLIETEQKCGVLDEEKDPMKRLNYQFYELVYMWAKKQSFISIKYKFPNVEEGIMIKMILDIKKLCKVVKEMAILIGDVSLG